MEKEVIFPKWQVLPKSYGTPFHLKGAHGPLYEQVASVYSFKNEFKGPTQIVLEQGRNLGHEQSKL